METKATGIFLVTCINGKDALCYALESLELQYGEKELEEILNTYYLKLYPDVMNALKVLGLASR
ncbi:hypothetical protein [Lacrimispora sp.]|uniref:hypothetical protein n=1 Tax=Lacrimispora sp. TaxID=2719234 RepID=UPI003992B445